MDFEIDARELGQMAQRYAGAQKIVTDELGKAVMRSAIVVQTDARRAVPVDTGRLKNSIAVEGPKRMGDAIIAKVGTNVTYGPHVEFGTGPRVIYPRNKRALFWPGARHPVAYVNHPGTRKRPYLVPALTNNIPRIRALIGDGVTNAMRRIGGGR